MGAPERVIANMDGEAALPRKNGELVFESPWEGRAFGMAIALTESQGLAWDEFRSRLIAEIGAAEREGADSAYYERWLASLERLLLDRGFVSATELEARMAEFVSGERDEVF